MDRKIATCFFALSRLAFHLLLFARCMHSTFTTISRGIKLKRFPAVYSKNLTEHAIHL